MGFHSTWAWAWALPLYLWDRRCRPSRRACCRLHRSTGRADRSHLFPQTRHCCSLLYRRRLASQVSSLLVRRRLRLHLQILRERLLLRSQIHQERLLRPSRTHSLLYFHNKRASQASRRPSCLSPQVFSRKVSCLSPLGCPVATSAALVEASSPCLRSSRRLASRQCKQVSSVKMKNIDINLTYFCRSGRLQSYTEQ